MKKINNPYALMPALLIFWGSFAAVSKLMLADMDGYLVLFFIFLSGAAAMTAAGLINKKLFGLNRLGLKKSRALVFNGVFHFLYYFLYILALESVPSVTASMINYLFPIFIIVFAVPINKERLTAVKAVSAAVCFAGVAVILTDGRFNRVNIPNAAGGLLALGAAISWGLFSNFGKKNESGPFESYFVYVITGLMLSIPAVLIKSSFVFPGYVGLAGCFWLGLSNLALAFPIWFKALKSSSSGAANLSFFAPFVTLIFIAALTDEIIAPSAVAGVILIVAGNVLPAALKRFAPVKKGGA